MQEAMRIDTCNLLDLNVMMFSYAGVRVFTLFGGRQAPTSALKYSAASS